MNKFLELMKLYNVPISTKTLCMGFRLNEINYESFKNYELIKLLDEKNITQVVKLNLFDSRDKIELDQLCDQVLGNSTDEELFNEKSKWSFARLKFLRETITDPKELLSKVAEVYADFDYPVSMEGLIYYMPPSGNYDPTQFTIDENRERLIQKLDEYLNNIGSSFSR